MLGRLLGLLGLGLRCLLLLVRLGLLWWLLLLLLRGGSVLWCSRSRGACFLLRLLRLLLTLRL